MRFRSSLSLLLISLCGPTLAGGLTVGDLPSDYCGDDDTNLAITRAVSDGGCVLKFSGHANDPETEADIFLDGSVIKIIRASRSTIPGNKNKNQPSLGNRERWTFYSLDKSTKVTLISEVINTSCEVNSESCCGDNYDGKLTVERGADRATISVTYYRGG